MPVFGNKIHPIRTSQPFLFVVHRVNLTTFLTFLSLRSTTNLNVLVLEQTWFRFDALRLLWLLATDRHQTV
jgi:hypothetical protein